jgi:hypothetical protein
MRIAFASRIDDTDKIPDYTDEKSDYNGISQSSGHYVIRIHHLVRLGRFDRLERLDRSKH